MQLQRLREPRPRTIWNKVDQAVRAEQVERREGKEAILTEYLNRAPFGGNLIGAGAASWRYFGRPCRDLSLSEAALLAGLPQGPNRLRPDRHPEAARARRDHVLDRMLARGFISQKERDEAIAEPVNAAWRPLPQEEDAGALPTLIDLAARHGGGSTTTTLDRRMQRIAFELARSHVESLKASGVTAGAVVILDVPSGDLLASVTIDVGERIDLTRRARSTGSTLKPFIYAAAFDAGIAGPHSTLLDSPAAWAGYEPNNYDRAFVGALPASAALAESRNVPALTLLNEVGVERAVGVLDAMGLEHLARGRQKYGLSLAIGGAEATPLELARAYATLARGGVTLTPSPSTPGEGRGGGYRVLREEACWQTLWCIDRPARTQDVCAEAAALGVAWKTGTSSGHRDAWCAAVTPRLAIVVWLGNPQGQGAAALIGQEAAAPLALRLISTLDPGGKGFPEPAANHSPMLAAGRIKPRLVIASPSPNQRFVLNPDLPTDRQQVRLETTAREGELWWFVDDQPVARGARAWYSPKPGMHRIRLADGEGHGVTADIEVVGPRDNAFTSR
jgi:penicillin-binding protein 1C